MADYKYFLKIAEAGLQGDQPKLIKLLQEIAAKEVNKNRHNLYNGLLKLINTYSHKDDYLSLSSFDQRPNQDSMYLFSQLWVSKEINQKLSEFIDFYKNKHDLHFKSLNHLNKILLYGPPGTGKTTLGFYIAHLLNKTIKYIKISDVVSSKFGETLKNISDIFLNTSEEIIFIDEFDAFAKSRTDNNDVGELKRIVNSIIQTLDFQSRNKLIIVSTNLIDSIDTAILRRFPFKIFVGLLTYEQKRDFLTFLINEHKNTNIQLSYEDIDLLIKFLDLNTIDEVKTFFEKALINAYIKKLDTINLNSFLEMIFADESIQKKKVKQLKKDNPIQLRELVNFLRERGLSQKEISNVLGIHRNSLKNYVK